jgi:hypothetical protein
MAMKKKNKKTEACKTLVELGKIEGQLQLLDLMSEWLEKQKATATPSAMAGGRLSSGAVALRCFSSVKTFVDAMKITFDGTPYEQAIEIAENSEKEALRSFGMCN